MEDKKEWIGWRILDAVAKIIIPLLLAVIAWQQNQAAQRRSAELTKEQAEATQRQIQLKYIELVWTSMIGKDDNAKLLSMKLLKSLDSTTAATLSSAISQDATQSQEVRKAASDAVTNTALDVLKGMRIDIFLKDGSGRERRQATADSIQRLIAQQNLGNTVRIRIYTEGDFPTSPARANEVRFDSEKELLSAQVLAALLNGENPGRNFQLRKVRTSTPGYLSIMIL